MCVGKRGRLRHVLVCFPTPKGQNGKRVGGREFAIIGPNHGTRLRPQCAWKSGAPARAPREGGEPRGPCHRPDAQPSAVNGFPNVSTTTRTKKPIRSGSTKDGRERQPKTPHPHPPDVQFLNGKTAKAILHRGTRFIQSHFSSQPAARRPSTSETPYQLGSYGPGCDGTKGREAAHRPTFA